MADEARRSAPLVGRQREISLLRDHRDALRRGRGSIVVVHGEAGIGKTRLLEAFCSAEESGRSSRLVRAECFEHARQPLGPFRAIVSKLAVATRDELRLAPAYVVQAVERMSIAAALTPSATQLGKADLLVAIEAFFTLVARKRTTVIVIEDIHWADAATLELLRYLASSIGSIRLLFLISLRDDRVDEASAFGSTLARLQRERTVRFVPIERLTPDETATLVGLVSNDRSLAPAVRRDIERSSGGNPLFVEELVRDALAARSKTRSLPRTIRATLESSLARVTDDDRDVLVHAAILGYRFDPVLLGVVLDRDAHSISMHLARACARNVLVEEPVVPLRFRFHHALLQRALVEGVLLATRRPIHERIALAIEASPGGGDRIDELAYHWSAAANVERALDANESAGEAAFALNAFAQASEYFASAIGFATDDVRRARLLMRLAAAEGSQSRTDESRAAYDAAAKIHLDRGDATAAARAVELGATQQNNAGDAPSAVESIDVFLREHRGAVSTATHDSMRITQAAIAANIPAPERAHGLLRAVIAPEALDRQARLRFAIARATANAGSIGGPYVAADIEAGAACVPSGNDLLDAMSLKQAGMLAMITGQPVLAERLLGSAIELCGRYGFIGLEASARALLAGNLYLTGRFAEAHGELVAAMRHRHHFITRMHVSLVGPFVAYAAGDDALAIRCIDIDHVTSGRAGPQVLGSYARALLSNGKTGEARVCLRQSVDRLDGSFFTAFMLPFAAEHVAFERVPNLLRALQHDGLDDDPWRRACFAHVSAIAAARAGDTAAARAGGLDAAERYDAIGWRLFAAQSLEAAGESFAAAERYRELGSIGDLRRLSLVRPPTTVVRRDSLALSERETEIARLVGRGRSNREVAQALFITEKTVEKHLSSIYRKLGVATRSQLAAHIATEAVS